MIVTITDQVIQLLNKDEQLQDEIIFVDIKNVAESVLGKPLNLPAFNSVRYDGTELICANDGEEPQSISIVNWPDVELLYNSKELFELYELKTNGQPSDLHEWDDVNNVWVENEALTRQSAGPPSPIHDWDETALDWQISKSMMVLYSSRMIDQKMFDVLGYDSPVSVVQSQRYEEKKIQAMRIVDGSEGDISIITSEAADKNIDPLEVAESVIEQAARFSTANQLSEKKRQYLKSEITKRNQSEIEQYDLDAQITVFESELNAALS